MHHILSIIAPGTIVMPLFVAYWLLSDKREAYVDCLMFREGEIGWTIATWIYTLFPVAILIGWSLT